MTFFINEHSEQSRHPNQSLRKNTPGDAAAEAAGGVSAARGGQIPDVTLKPKS